MWCHFGYFSNDLHVMQWARDRASELREFWRLRANEQCESDVQSTSCHIIIIAIIRKPKATEFKIQWHGMDLFNPCTELTNSICIAHCHTHTQNWPDNNSGLDKLKFIFPIEIKWGIKELYSNQMNTTALYKQQQKKLCCTKLLHWFPALLHLDILKQSIV